MAFELQSVVEHWERERDDGDVEDGAEYVACAWWGQVRTVAVEELDVARFGAIGPEGDAEGGSF